MTSDFPLLARTRRLVLTCLISAMILLSSAAYAATDVVVFKNGDHLTGELKALDRGRLSFKTDATGTINIEWDKVAYVKTNQEIQVESQSGYRYYGHINRADDEDVTRVETNSGAVDLKNGRIVSMNPIDEGGFRNVDVNVALGYNFTKASNVTQFNFGADATYRTRKRVLSADISTVVSDSSNNDLSQRQSFSFNYTRLRTNRWLNDGGISLDQNDELGLNLRTSISTGVGRILRQTGNSSVILKGGLKATRENNTDQPEDVDSLESYGEFSWEWYRYDSPELDWSTNLEIIPSLTESGRVRGEFDATLKWEMINDLFWQLEFYTSYDNKPKGDTDTTNDYGVTTSVSYKF